MRTPLTAARFSLTLLVCMFAVVSVAQVSADESITVRATAGLGGLVKPGRWAPVQIRLTTGANLSAPVSRDVVVTWGDAVVRRSVALSPSSTFDFQLYTRTTDPTSTIRVEVAGTESRTEVPVTVVPHGTPVTVCVISPERTPGDGVACSATLTPRQLPASPRAYEVADQVITESGLHGLSSSQRAALSVWRALHPLEASGDLSSTPQVTRPPVSRGLPAATATAVAWTVLTYVGMLLGAAVLVATFRFRPWVPWLSFVGIVTITLAAATLVGRLGPASDVTVHHTSLLQQLPGTSGALLTTRAIAEFPSEGDTRLRLDVQDGSIEGAVAVGRAELLFDEGGFPILSAFSGRRGMGGRQSFTAEAVLDQQLLAIDEDGDRVQVVNRSDAPLHGCRFGDGLSPTDVGDLSPGGTAQGLRTGEVMGPLVTCTMSSPATMLSSPTHRVQMMGTTTVVAYLRRAQSLPEAPND